MSKEKKKKKNSLYIYIYIYIYIQKIKMKTPMIEHLHLQAGIERSKSGVTLLGSYHGAVVKGASAMSAERIEGIHLGVTVREGNLNATYFKKEAA